MIGEILAASGLFFSAIGVLGVLRMPDFMNRMHSTTIITTFGIVLTMLGAVAFSVEAGDFSYAKSALMIAGFVMLTGAIGSHAVARACFTRGIVPKNLVKNEFPRHEAKK